VTSPTKRSIGFWAVIAALLASFVLASDDAAPWTAARLTPEALAGATYTLPDGNQVTLVNGRLRVPAAPAAATMTMDLALRADLTAFGDLDGDGVDDAAVILVNAPGGSGVFLYLAAVLNAAGAPVNPSTVELGDRTRIESREIEDSSIVLNVVAHRKGDPMCCPTERRVWTYQLRGDQLARNGDDLTATIPAAPAADPHAQGTAAVAVLTQNVWQWQATRMNDDTSRTPADPAAYTVRFGADGTISVKADCNAALGTYRVDGSGIEIVMGPMTLAECPPGSPSGKFVQDLGAAVLWTIRDQELLLDLKFDSGTMRFIAEARPS
jgi:heat shock protein HslJ